MELNSAVMVTCMMIECAAMFMPLACGCGCLLWWQPPSGVRFLSADITRSFELVLKSVRHGKK